MHLRATTFDDLMRKSVYSLLKRGRSIRPFKGDALELTGSLLELKNPRARLSSPDSRHVLFGALGELFWYLSGSDSADFICYYLPRYRESSDDGLRIHGAYGPRIFVPAGSSQFDRVRAILREKRDSRQAVIQLFSAQDLEIPHKDVPCTCNLQFFLREGRLHLLVSMRSNDVFVGLPHDVFAFTMIQELLATSIGARLGWYKHAVGSLHLYRDDVSDAKRYLEQGWQAHEPMPPMPRGDPWLSLPKLQAAERRLRDGKVVNIEQLELDPYWKDLVRLLDIYASYRFSRREVMTGSAARSKLSVRTYDRMIERRLRGKRRPS